MRSTDIFCVAHTFSHVSHNLHLKRDLQEVPSEQFVECHRSKQLNQDVNEREESITLHDIVIILCHYIVHVCLYDGVLLLVLLVSSVLFPQL